VVARTHFSTRVLGDLPIEEAHEYYLQQVRNFPEPPELFPTDQTFFKSNVFHITGGRMWFIDRYIGQIKEDKKPISTAQEFIPVQVELGSMKKLSLSSEIYSEDDFALALRKLTESQSGFISYNILCKELGGNDGNVTGMNKVSALISNNILHYRPPSNFARDLVPPPTSEVITAPSQPALRAMELFLARNN